LTGMEVIDKFSRIAFIIETNLSSSFFVNKHFKYFPGVVLKLCAVYIKWSS
jgi:hypothetical protein